MFFTIPRTRVALLYLFPLQISLCPLFHSWPKAQSYEGKAEFEAWSGVEEANPVLSFPEGGKGNGRTSMYYVVADDCLGRVLAYFSSYFSELLN